MNDLARGIFNKINFDYSYESKLVKDIYNALVEVSFSDKNDI